VPDGRVIPLEKWEDGSYKFHGALQPGELYLITTDGITSNTYYYAPRLVGSNIVNDGVNYSLTAKGESAAWTVTAKADNYRFTVIQSSRILRGEIFTWWYETWIVGGCTQDGQGGWNLEAGKPMVQNPNNPYEWTWVGELKDYSGNVESKRFKILGQYGWNPKSFHPYRQDASILKAKQAIYNNSNDYKWSIDQDGYYRITCNVFLETVTGEYLGTELPETLGSTTDRQVRISARGRTIRIESDEAVSVSFLSLGGQVMGKTEGLKTSSWTAPSSGVYLVEIEGNHTRQTRKVLVSD